MKKVYGYDEECIYLLESTLSSIIKGEKLPYKNSLKGWGRCKDKSQIRMVPDINLAKVFNRYNRNDDSSSFYELPQVVERIVTPEPGDSLYFIPSCKIPRIKIEGIWKRTVRPANADVVVIPEPGEGEFNKQSLVLLNKDAGKIFIIDTYDSSSSGLNLYPMQPGETFIQYLMRRSNNGRLRPEDVLREEDLVYFRDIVCPSEFVYFGPIVTIANTHSWMFDVLDGMYPRIIFENDLLALIEDDELKFDEGCIEPFIEILRSTDKGSVQQGLRTLASMDYAHYPSVTRYILSQAKDTIWEARPYNSAVKFMFNNLSFNPRWSCNPFDKVSREEFELAKPILKEIIRMEIENSIGYSQSKTNLNLKVDFTVDLDYPGEEPCEVPDALEETPDETPEEGDGLGVFIENYEDSTLEDNSEALPEDDLNDIIKSLPTV
jgi:hypothetical protein